MRISLLRDLSKSIREGAGLWSDSDAAEKAHEARKNTKQSVRPR